MAEILPVANTETVDRRADIVFLHGLDGDARLTWGATRHGNDYDLDAFWPRSLGQDLPDAAIWSVQYDAAASKWTGATMPIGDRATNLLELLHLSGIGERPLIFITHSMGGLIVKQMLHDLATNTNVRPEWKRIFDHARGIAFFSTPHNGSWSATWMERVLPLRPGPNIAELAANNPHLRKLNQWFRNNIDPNAIHLLVYCETRTTRKMRIVDEGSADPGMRGVPVIPLDFDHIEICKVVSKDRRYVAVVEFIKHALAKQARPDPVRNDQSLLDAAESVVARFRELDSRIAVSVGAILRFNENWTAQQREELVKQMQDLAHSELFLSKARTAAHHLQHEVQVRMTNNPPRYLIISNEILSACRTYLYALCPNDRVTPFPSTDALQQFLNEIVEVGDAAGAERVTSVAKTLLGMPAKSDLENAERALGELRSIIAERQIRREEKRDRRFRDDSDDIQIG